MGHARIATASAAFVFIAACGGGGVKLQIVSVGDSLSDVGTYAPVTAANFGGGRFTTNPGQVWVQNVAQYYGDTLKPAQTGGFGVAQVSQLGLDYAQGGSRVTNPIGIGHATSDPANYSQALTVSGLMSKVIFIYLDIVPALTNITANYQQFGFTVSNIGTACNLQAMARGRAEVRRAESAGFRDLGSACRKR